MREKVCGWSGRAGGLEGLFMGLGFSLNFGVKVLCATEYCPAMV